MRQFAKIMLLTAACVPKLTAVAPVKPVPVMVTTVPPASGPADGLTVTVGVGQSVRWVNDDPVEHTITFDGSEPGSPLVPQNGTFVHRFDRAGTYTYHCTPHPFMKGVVVVR